MLGTEGNGNIAHYYDHLNGHLLCIIVNDVDIDDAEKMAVLDGL